MSSAISGGSGAAGGSKRRSVPVYAWILLLAVAFVMGALLSRALRIASHTRSLPRTPQAIAEEFHKLYYNSHHRTWNNTFGLALPFRSVP